MTFAKLFRKKSKKIAFDERHRATIRFNISKYDAAVAKGKERHQNLDLAKEYAASVKRDAIARLPDYLEQFEKKISKRGVRVLWAKDGDEASGYLKDIIRKHNAKRIVKSKSMTTEEIDFNAIASALGCESVETDLGEFIVQTADEKPYHIVTPAMHKSRKDIAHLFHKKFGTPIESSPEQMTDYVRTLLRQKFVTADIGVTGANFLIADIGGVAVTENEGNALMCAAFPKVHVVIAGIEKIIPSVNDLDVFWQLLALHGTGQQITNYNSIFTSAKKSTEHNAPEKMYVILLDNGRSNIYADENVREALACIRCGACLNACPVYKTIGGYTYNCTYSGPIGSVITPFLKGFQKFGHLCSACSLCRACAEVCPVKIPLPDLLLYTRSKAAKGFLQTAGMHAFCLLSKRRSRYEMCRSSIKNLFLHVFNPFLWGNKRVFPRFAKQSFAKQYKIVSKGTRNARI